MTGVRATSPKSLTTAAEVDAERGPLETPKSYLTLSAGPDLQHQASDTLSALRSERDPVTPDLLDELARSTWLERIPRRWPARAVGGSPIVAAQVAEITEAELRGQWGDR